MGLLIDWSINKHLAQISIEILRNWYARKKNIRKWSQHCLWESILESMSYASVEYKSEENKKKMEENKSLNYPHLLSINCKLINEKSKKL